MIFRTSIAFAVSLFTPALGWATPQSCSDWTEGFHGPGVSGAVWDALDFGTGTNAGLYLGGDFEFAGGQPAGPVVRWDGTQFESVGDFGEHVNALAEWDDGSGPALYAAGFRSGITSIVARWNGAAWDQVGGVFDTANALASFDDGTGSKLYLAGDFNLGLRSFDGSSWVFPGGGLELPGPGDVSVKALEVHDDGSGSSLFVGGRFDLAGGLPTSNIARWDGSSWFQVGGGLNGEVWDLVVFGGELYAAGEFTQSALTPLVGVARWDGVQWSPVGSGLLGGEVTELGVFDDGSGVALYAGGGFTQSGAGTPMSGFARWDGQSWVEVGGGVNGVPATLYGDQRAGIHLLLAHDFGAGDELLVGGSFNRAGSGATGVGTRGVARWDGAWQPFDPVGNGVDDNIQALLTFDDGSGPALYAGGDFGSAGTTMAERIARFDGTAWSALGSGLPDKVRALAAFDFGAGEQLVAGGDFSSLGHLASWDGATWAAVPGGVDGLVRAVGSIDLGSGPELYAGGDFTLAGGQPANRIARFDGVAWHPLGSGVNGDVRALAVYDRGQGPELFVGGSFTTAGGVTAPYFAAWDGSAWSDLGGGLSNKVLAMRTWDDGNGEALFLTGSFLSPVLGASTRIARYDGSWSGLGIGLYGPGRAIGVWDDGSGTETLVVGGNGGVRFWDATKGFFTGPTQAKGTVRALATFSGAGGWPALYSAGDFETEFNLIADSENIARWENPCACEGITYCTSGTSANGCVASVSSTGTASRSVASGFVVNVTDVEGGAKGLIYFGTSGPQANAWGNGTSFQCVAPPVQRTGISSAGGVTPCGGALSLDFNAWMSANASAAPGAGTTAWMQAWYRDPGSTSNQTTSLSDGLQVSICP